MFLLLYPDTRSIFSQVKRLEAEISSRTEGLGSATSHIDDLKSSCNKLQQQLGETTAQLRQMQEKHNNLLVGCFT